MSPTKPNSPMLDAKNCIVTTFSSQDYRKLLPGGSAWIYPIITLKEGREIIDDWYCEVPDPGDLAEAFATIYEERPASVVLLVFPRLVPLSEWKAYVLSGRMLEVPGLLGAAMPPGHFPELDDTIAFCMWSDEDTQHPPTD